MSDLTDWAHAAERPPDRDRPEALAEYRRHLAELAAGAGQAGEEVAG